MEAPLGSCLVLKEERSWRPSQDDGGHLMEKPRANVWSVENAGATFLVCSPEDGSPDGECRLFGDTGIDYTVDLCSVEAISCLLGR